MCLSLLLQMEFFTFQRNIFCFQPKVYVGGKSLRMLRPRTFFPLENPSRMPEKKQWKQLPPNRSPSRLLFPQLQEGSGSWDWGLATCCFQCHFAVYGVSRGSLRIDKNQTWIILDRGQQMFLVKGQRVTILDSVVPVALLQYSQFAVPKAAIKLRHKEMRITVSQ